ncbi:DNA phosphorothioation-associated putative methyltransferase [Rhodococcus fascians]|nr:DNA phosphorothioation-associated putative methyltransferase [Rhodococcus fascians]MBY4116316.1 DNA phosphorothioation-associated putative methyltransferase [Rhodococcus fascians]
MHLENVARHRTAMARTALSRPVETALADQILTTGMSFFDYGCGRGDDLRGLSALGYQASGWDPGHRPEAVRSSADVVNLGFVVNVIENPAERLETVRSAWVLARRVLIVSGRLVWEARHLVGRRFADGIITQSGTFQKFYEQNELSNWIEQALGEKPVAAAPGIFYVFRDEVDEQQFLSNRVHTYRPRVQIDPHVTYEQNSELLEPLLEFMSRHGRYPKTGELEVDHERSIKEQFQTLGRAMNLIYKVTEDTYWDRVRTQCKSELVVYAALSRFGRRPKFGSLGKTLQRDIKTHFNTYREVTTLGDRLLASSGNPTLILMSARSSKVGKQTPSALYVHRNAVAELPPLLQVYEGCARVLSGNIPRANMIKLSVLKPQISFLTYPEFEANAHPTLASAVTVNLRDLSVDWRDYTRSTNPPLLHRKEEFVSADDPRRALYQKLTASEVRAGLYERPEQIGSLDGWRRTLELKSKIVRGHRLFSR